MNLNFINDLRDTFSLLAISAALASPFAAASEVISADSATSLTTGATWDRGIYGYHP